MREVPSRPLGASLASLVRRALAVDALALALSFGAGCGGATATLSDEDRASDERALAARDDHDALVRTVGDVDGPPVSGEAACGDACARRERVRDLAARICGASERDRNDAATEFLCEDGREREASLVRRVEGCGCAP